MRFFGLQQVYNNNKHIVETYSNVTTFINKSEILSNILIEIITVKLY